MRVLIPLLLVTLVSCSKTPEIQPVKKQAATFFTQETHPGKQLMTQYCNACHNATGSHDARIAPPMIAIKKHYKSYNTTLEQFSTAFVNFVMHPSEDNAKMRGAVRRFGLMPKQVFKEQDLKTIAEYVYSFEIEAPSWFEQHWKERGQKGQQKGRHKGEHAQKKKQGLAIAMKTKQQLAQNLIGTLQSKGTLAALKFCHVKAYPLTDSMARTHKGLIKRVSDKPRNVENRASAKESMLITSFQKKLDQGSTYEPVVERTANGSFKFYSPIVTNPLCLQCHGKPIKDIESTTLQMLKKLYPQDLAVGYTNQQVRGLWRIEFD